MEKEIEKAIHDAVLTVVNKITEEEIKLAQERIRTRLMSETARLACVVAQRFEYEKMQKELAIIVKWT